MYRKIVNLFCCNCLKTLKIITQENPEAEILTETIKTEIELTF